MTNMNIKYICCRTKKNVDDLLILTDKTLTGRLAFVVVRLDAAEAEEGFSSLARALSSAAGGDQCERGPACKEGRPENHLRVLGLGWSWSGTTEDLYGCSWEDVSRDRRVRGC